MQISNLIKFLGFTLVKEPDQVVLDMDFIEINKRLRELLREKEIKPSTQGEFS